MIKSVNKDMSYVLCYTRVPKEEQVYSSNLAYSMHLGFSKDGEKFNELNHNYGVLFAKATENNDGSLNAKCLKNPYIFNLKDGSFGVVAVRINPKGENDEESKGKVLLFKSCDLLEYEEVGLIDLPLNDYVDDVICEYDEKDEVYNIFCKDENGTYYKSSVSDITDLESIHLCEKCEAFNFEKVNTDIEGAISRNVIAVSNDICTRLVSKLTVPMNTKIEVQESASIKSAEELKNIKVKAIYSDGTSNMKPVDWDMSTIDWGKAGEYKICGSVHQDHYEFPLLINRADPCIAKWNGKYYFIATNDADGNHSLYMREADTIPELFSAEEVLLIDSNTYSDIKGLLWAPEFHEVNGELYIFHGATSSEFYFEESHVMKLKHGGNPINPEDWSRPNRVVDKNGNYLCEAGKTISLDMTCYEVNNEYYVMWSQRQFLPNDLGAFIYIAKVDPNEPWKLITDPVVICKPEYSWENNHVFVSEGPFALIKDNKVFLAFSGALIDATYAVGFLVADVNSNLLDRKSWTKTNYPLLTSNSIEGEFGPGHNSFVIDDDGLVWNAYHARPGIDNPRSSGLRRVHFDIDGYPVLDLPEDRDLNKELKEVSLKVIIK